jgi:hypothetical protein
MSREPLSLVVLERIRLARMSETINAVERKLAKRAMVPPEPRHYFTPGLYSRELRITPEPGMAIICTSALHTVEHQFILSKGKCSVWQENTGWVHLRAPFHGITKPGARRILVVWEDLIWTTFHPNPKNLDDPEEFREMVTENMPLGGDS